MKNALVAFLCSGRATAGVRLIASITIIWATTVSNIGMRFFMRYPLSEKGGTRQQRRVT